MEGLTGALTLCMLGNFVCFSCVDPGILVREGPCQSEKKSSDNVFFFLVLSLIYRSQMVNFTENYHFSRFRRGSNIFQGGGGGPTFSRGSNCLFPIKSILIVIFQGGSGLPVTPLEPHLLFWCLSIC